MINFIAITEHYWINNWNFNSMYNKKIRWYWFRQKVKECNEIYPQVTADLSHFRLIKAGKTYTFGFPIYFVIQSSRSIFSPFFKNFVPHPRLVHIHAWPTNSLVGRVLFFILSQFAPSLLLKHEVALVKSKEDEGTARGSKGGGSRLPY